MEILCHVCTGMPSERNHRQFTSLLWCPLFIERYEFFLLVDFLGSKSGYAGSQITNKCLILNFREETEMRLEIESEIVCVCVCVCVCV